MVPPSHDREVPAICEPICCARPEKRSNVSAIFESRNNAAYEGAFFA